jgi:hypothetical protein
MAKPSIAEELAASDAALEQRQSDRQISELKSKLARSEQKRKLAETAVEELEAIDEFRKGLGGDGGASFEPFVPKKPSGTATGIICLNDWHCEETVDPNTINGLNTFDLSIAEKRIKRVAERTLRLLDAQRRLSNIRDLVVWLGGDLVSGFIHDDLVEGNSLSPIDACIWAKSQIIGVLDYWLEHGDLSSITVPESIGNHGRTTKKPRISTAANHSFEYWMYHNIADIFAARGEKRVRFKIEKGYHNWLDIQGKRVRFHHGDWIKYQGGVGGITIPVNKAINEWNKAQKADYDFFGHWHQHEKHRRWTACNCLIGYSAYALSIKAEYSEPSQTFAVFDRNKAAPVSVTEVFCD